MSMSVVSAIVTEMLAWKVCCISPQFRHKSLYHGFTPQQPIYFLITKRSLFFNAKPCIKPDRTFSFLFLSFLYCSIPNNVALMVVECCCSGGEIPGGYARCCVLCVVCVSVYMRCTYMDYAASVSNSS